MNETIELFVKKHWIKKIPDLTIIKTSEKVEGLEILRKAGFESIVGIHDRQKSEEESQITRTKIAKRFSKNYILLKKQEFERKRIFDSEDVKITIIFSLLAIASSLITIAGLFEVINLGFAVAILPAAIFWMLTFLFVTDDTQRNRFDVVKFGSKYLVESELKNYTGNVPVSVAEKVIEAKQLKLTPRIWFIAGRDRIHSLTKGRVIEKFDPLLIGIHKSLPDYVVLLAIWGEDIEDLSKMFNENK